MKNKGLLFALVAMLISGVSVFANAQLVKGMDPILQTTIKNCLTGILLLFWMLATSKFSSISRLSSKNWVKLLVVALIGGSVSFGLYFTGLKMIGVIEGSLIQKSMILWVSLLAILFLKEKIVSWFSLAAVGLYAVNFVGGVQLSTLNLGHLLVLLATLCWSLEAIIIKRFLSQVDVDILLFGRMVLGTGFLAIYTTITGKWALLPSITALQWQALVLVSLLLFGYVMMWYRAIQCISPVVVSSILVGATVITTMLMRVFAG